MAIDPLHLPSDPKVLQRMVLDLLAQLDRECGAKSKIEAMLRELLDAERGRKSEQLPVDQLALFAVALQALHPEAEAAATDSNETTDKDGDSGAGGNTTGEAIAKKTGGRQPLARHLKRERIVHDLAEAEKHCSVCAQDLRPIGEETSERYEFIPASLKVIEDACLRPIGGRFRLAAWPGESRLRFRKSCLPDSESLSRQLWPHPVCAAFGADASPAGRVPDSPLSPPQLSEPVVSSPSRRRI